MTEKNETFDPNMWASVLHAGLAGSFMRLPHVPPRANDLKAAGAKAVIYGIPWDSTSISRTGANYGPRGIREVSTMLTPYNAVFDFDLAEALHPVDAGDCHTTLANAVKTFDAAEKDITEILDAGALPVVFGGDHSISIPVAGALKKRYEHPGLVLIDMHLDTAEEVGGEKLNHCCPITRAIDAGFDPKKTVLIGMSGWMNPRSERQYCIDHGITVIWLEDVWERGTAAVVEEAVSIAGGGDGIYLTFDIDALDAAYAPGTCAPSPGGMSSREAIELVRGISKSGLVAFDVVEVAPSLDGDTTSSTSLIAGRLALEAMAAHAGMLSK